jgi:acyl-CoA synthetase (AMP-forming)/AMP-acid ligase II
VGQETLARTLVTTPLSFGMGAHALCATLCAGGAAILPERFPGAIVRAIDRWRPTWAYVVPALLEAILEDVGQSGRLAFAEWQGVSVAGMAPSRTLADRVETVFGLSLAEGYGCGEAGLIAGTMRAGERSPGVMDRVFTPGIATIDNRGAPTAPGMPGEIVVWGPQVSAAYLGDAQATAASFVADGTFRTGDIGVLDETGRLHLVGRVKEIINRGGEKLAPEEIEAVLMAHPAVLEAAVFPVPHARLGEEVAAAVIPRPGAVVTERDLRRHVANHLALAKVPHRVWFVDALPRTATGKIRRGDLARRYGPVWRADPSG